MDEQTALERPEGYKRQICCMRLLAGSSAAAAGRNSSAYFLLDLHYAWEQQDGLAVRLKNSKDLVSMYGQMDITRLSHHARDQL